jgi:hypothetical protein
MRVLLLRQEPCARARVHAVALAAVHPEIELGLARQGSPGGEGLENEWQLGDRPARGLREAISELAPDVIHSYTDSLTVCAHELTAGRIPVVHDVKAEDSEVERRAVEESDAVVVASQELLEVMGASYILPPVTCVFPSYPLARELPADERDLGAEANIDRLGSLYQSLVREPMAGIATELRGR